MGELKSLRRALREVGDAELNRGIPKRRDRAQDQGETGGSSWEAPGNREQLESLEAATANVQNV